MLGDDAVVSPGGFACAACTLVNGADAAVCAACQTPRPETAEAAQRSEALLALGRGGAAAVTSLHAHPVRNVTGSREWTCDACGKDCEMGRDARYRCGVCADYDACAACFEQQPHDHALKLVTVFAGGKWFCDVCRAEGRPLDSGGGAAGAGQPLRRFRCYDCADYDLCGDCVRQNMRLVPRFNVDASDAHAGTRPITEAEWLECPMVGLAEATAGLALTVPGVVSAADEALAFGRRHAARFPSLTVDHIAAINLYTKQNEDVPDHSFFKLLNQALNSRERAGLAPFFPYLRLVADAERLLPNVGPCDVLRVFPTQQAGWEDTYRQGSRVHWWGFSSTTKNGNGAVLVDPMFFGTAGQRMLFTLHVVRGIDISAFSDFPQEDEVLLMPGAVFAVTQVVPPGMLGGAAMVLMQQLEDGEALAPAAAPALAPAPTADEAMTPEAAGGYTCAACTLVNGADAAVCAACQTPRPETAEAAQRSEALLALGRGGAAAVTSLHAHPVRNVTGSREWTCDACGKDCEMGRDARYRCGVCADYDACAACFEQQPHDHALKLVTVFAGGKWFCDVCRAEGRPLDSGGGAAGAGQPLRRFRCYDCADYDLCGDCVQANLSSA